MVWGWNPAVLWTLGCQKRIKSLKRKYDNEASASHCPVIFDCCMLGYKLKKSEPLWSWCRRLGRGVIFCLSPPVSPRVFTLGLLSPPPVTFEHIIHHIVVILMFWFIFNEALTGWEGRLKASLSARQQQPPLICHNYTRQSLFAFKQMPLMDLVYSYYHYSHYYYHYTSAFKERTAI